MSQGMSGRAGVMRSWRLEPVRRESTVDLIADRIREAITDGTLPPGATLGEAEMAQQLGVSRGPLREAMQRLVQQGLLSTTRRRGQSVVTMTREDVFEVYELRTAVEQAAARRLLSAGDRAIKEAVKAGKAELTRMRRAAAKGAARQLGDADLAFHRVLVDCAGSLRLSRQIRTLLVETRLCTFSMYENFEVRLDLAEDHAVLLDAVRAGDPEYVCSLLAEHMYTAAKRLTTPPARTEDIETIQASTPDTPQPLDRLELP